jgi:hypothetical protein
MTGRSNVSKPGEDAVSRTSALRLTCPLTLKSELASSPDMFDYDYVWYSGCGREGC